MEPISASEPEISTNQSLLARARLAVDEHQYELAEELLREFVDENPTSADAHVYLGIAAINLEKAEDALRALNHAITLDSASAFAYVWRAHVWSHLREQESAIKDLQSAIRLAPDNAAARKYLGKIWLDEGNLDEAERELFQALLLHPGDSDSSYYLAKLERRKGNTDRAITYLSESIRVEPESPAAYRMRASLHRSMDRLDLALADLTQLTQLCPEDESAKAMGETLRQLLEQTVVTTTSSIQQQSPRPRELVYTILRDHFAPTALEDLVVQGRLFPHRVRADLQLAVDEIVKQFAVKRFITPKTGHWSEGSIAALMVRPEHEPPVPIPPEYEEIDVGDAEPVQCLKCGIWLFEDQETMAAIYLFPNERYGCIAGVKVEIAFPLEHAKTEIAKRIFAHLEKSIKEARSYRGKVLSLEVGEQYSGTSSGIRVHKLSPIARHQVILPAKTVDLLERNVVGFMRQRPQLAKLGLSTKKGILFYGPPGTGKTHTISFLAGSLPGVTTLLITAEQIGHLDEYMTLARLLQPSIVVIEDADLIARNREDMGSPCEEVLLNKLLNEMDGLRENAEIFFILTTNRPEALEGALASRPGRIDQAIEFPKPDAECRQKLLLLYAAQLQMSTATLAETVKRTDNCSAAFLKELVRRSAQFCFERGGDSEIEWQDVEHSLTELLFAGGSLNRAILGAIGSPSGDGDG